MESADHIQKRAREILAQVVDVDVLGVTEKPAFTVSVGQAVRAISEALRNPNIGLQPSSESAKPVPTTDVIRDAERYQWLRLRKVCEEMPRISGVFLDSYVDAAIREQKRANVSGESDAK